MASFERRAVRATNAICEPKRQLDAPRAIALRHTHGTIPTRIGKQQKGRYRLSRSDFRPLSADSQSDATIRRRCVIGRRLGNGVTIQKSPWIAFFFVSLPIGRSRRANQIRFRSRLTVCRPPRRAKVKRLNHRRALPP